MKQFIDFIPLILFFIVYKIDPQNVEFAGFNLSGIYGATATLILASVIVYGALWLKHRHLEKSQWFTLGACLVLGGLTLAFHEDTFLKWKAPLVNWLFALAFAGSHFIGDKPMIQRIMGHAIQLPQGLWVRLNIAWVVFFLVCGFANLYVVFTYPNFWVDFKVFGSLGMTLLFLIGHHCLLLSLGASLALAEEPAPAPIPAAQPSITQATAELERRLVETERQRDELVSRMRQENRQLREQLQAAQAQRQPPLLTEEQTWYVAGAATALLAFVLGALSRGRRRQRREWIN